MIQELTMLIYLAIVLQKKKISMVLIGLPTQLHLMVTTIGIPVHYVLAHAAFHDVMVALDLLETYQKNIVTLGNKGYVGIQKRLNNPEHHELIIQGRDNQKKQNTASEKRILGCFKKIIEIGLTQNT